MFSRKKAPAGGKERIRKLLHDVRASHHAAKLNAEAGHILVSKLSGDTAARLRKHLQLLNSDLDKLEQQVELLAQVVKENML